MMLNSSRRRVFLTSLAGAALGYFFLHPYTMMVYGIYGKRQAEHIPGLWGGLEEFLDTFRAENIQMGLPFAILGAAAGLFFGFWLEARRQKEEAEMRVCAVDTMRELMVTLSHYLLNSATVVDGFSDHLLKSEKDEGVRRHLEAIKQEARSIEDVVKSLQSLQDVQTERYTKGSETLIIDINKQLEERLKESVEQRVARLRQGKAA